MEKIRPVHNSTSSPRISNRPAVSRRESGSGPGEKEREQFLHRQQKRRQKLINKKQKQNDIDARFVDKKGEKIDVQA